MMNYEAIQQEILKVLYQAWVEGEYLTGLRLLAEEKGWEEKEFHKAVDQLEQQSLVKVVASDWHSQITAHGVIFVEQHNLVPAEVVRSGLINSI